MNKKLHDFIVKANNDEAKREDFLIKSRVRAEEVRKERDSHLLPKLRFALPFDYVAWLKGFLDGGGEPTHLYDYPFPDTFYVAREDFRMIPLYGAMAIHIIVPSKIIVSHEPRKNIGHCTLYFMKGYEILGSWVPVYSDTRF